MISVFTSHYVTINSDVSSTRLSDVYVFTSHYVTINSDGLPVNLKSDEIYIPLCNY